MSEVQENIQLSFSYKCILLFKHEPKLKSTTALNRHLCWQIQKTQFEE